MQKMTTEEQQSATIKKVSTGQININHHTIDQIIA